MGLTPVAGNQLATIVTHLEMRQRPALRPLPPCPLRLVRWHDPSLMAYRTLFARVGGPWLWFSRLVMTDDELGACLAGAGTEVYAVTDPRGIEVGMLELDFGTDGECALSYFGLVPEMTGSGHGRWLMAQAMGLAWRRGVTCVTVHTCTLDHPSALNFYRAQGFVAVRREIETFPDPRLIGVLPRETAPHIPLFG